MAHFMYQRVPRLLFLRVSVRLFPDEISIRTGGLRKINCAPQGGYKWDKMEEKEELGRHFYIPPECWDGTQSSPSLGMVFMSSALLLLRVFQCRLRQTVTDFHDKHQRKHRTQPGHNPPAVLYIRGKPAPKTTNELPELPANINQSE